jgi:hypothetical protein
MCNRLLFKNEGRLEFDGTPQEFAAQGHNLDERFHELSKGAQMT